MDWTMLEKSCYIYLHKRLDTEEIFYVGIGTKVSTNGRIRGYERAYSKSNRNRHWKFIVNKTKYNIIIYKEKLTRKEANKIEIDLIQKYGRKDLNLGTLCNYTNGGDGIANLTPEIRKIMSEKRKNIIIKESTRKLMSANTKLRNKTHKNINYYVNIENGFVFSLPEWAIVLNKSYNYLRYKSYRKEALKEFNLEFAGKLNN